MAQSSSVVHPEGRQRLLTHENALGQSASTWQSAGVQTLSIQSVSGGHINPPSSHPAGEHTFATQRSSGPQSVSKRQSPVKTHCSPKHRVPNGQSPSTRHSGAGSQRFSTHSNPGPHSLLVRQAPSMHVPSKQIDSGGHSRSSLHKPLNTQRPSSHAKLSGQSDTSTHSKKGIHSLALQISSG